MRFSAQASLAFFLVVIATAVNAQTAPRQQHHANAASNTPAASLQPSTVTPAEPQSASSLLDQPAKPAQVGLDSGKLSVTADNSALSEILHDISAKTGMSVDGLSRDQRIFGTYGPAAPREVLSALLDGLGYNVLMVGSLNNGAPRELTLTPRTGGTSAPNSPATPRMRQEIANSNNNSDDEDETPPEQQQDTPIPPRPEAIAPEPTPAPDQQQQPGNQGQPGQVRTPQQMLQELQQMRQQQLQQMQQQQANPQ